MLIVTEILQSLSTVEPQVKINRVLLQALVQFISRKLAVEGLLICWIKQVK